MPLPLKTSLHDHLNHLETSLETPAVPGELEGWLNNVTVHLNNLLPILREAETLRSERLDQIERDDPGLAQRAKLLRKDSRDLLADGQAMARNVAKLVAEVAKAEPNEQPYHDRITSIVDHGIALIVRIRKLEKAVQTWSAESLNRDRGNAD